MNRCETIIEFEWVRITFQDGDVVEGRPISLDYADETDSGEDELCIENDDGIIGIKDSEISEWSIPLSKYKKKA